MNKRINKVGILVLSVLTVATIGLPVLALGSPDSHANAQTTTTDSTDKSTKQADKLANKQADQMADKIKLDEKHLKLCQKHEKEITHIMARVSDRSQKQLNLFSSIATKTETFYTNKGKTLSNYDALVADVASKKIEAQTAVDTVTATGVQFKCDGTDPKGVAGDFKVQLKAEIVALKAFKTSVKNLIVGVKSVQSTTTSTTNSAGGTQ
jgi:hypothetical protein